MSSATAHPGLADQTPDPPPDAPLRQIRNARSLFDELKAPDPASRFSALRAIQAQPRAALAFGLYNGADVIDVLLQQAAQFENTMEWMSWVGALAQFQDLRVTQLFLDIIATAEAPQVIFSAARYLSGSGTPPPSGTLIPLLLQNDNPIRARAVASLLPASPRLAAAARLRVALLSSADSVEMPAFDTTHSSLWLAELNGPFRMEARRALIPQGEPAWIALALLYDELANDDRLWLLQWGRRDFAHLTTGLLPHALQSASLPLIVEALTAISTLPDDALPDVRALAIPFLDHPDLKVRQAAVLAGPAGSDWRAFLDRETETAVRCPALFRLAHSEGEQAIPGLLRFLHSDDWQLRAAAAEALVSLGLPSAEAVKPLVHHPDNDVQVAAVRILLDLEQDSWLDQQFPHTT